MAMTVNPQDPYNKRLKLLKSERRSFIPLWKELSDYHLAFRGRFLVSDRNKGHKRNTKQINNHSRLAGRTLASGMMAGITSPARPWFRLATPDVEMMEFAPIKQWLFAVEALMREIFNQSNTYNTLHSLYSELGTFGTAAMGVYEDFDNVIRCQPYTVGSYMLGANGKGQVDTLYREFQLTVGAVVKEYGFDNCSQHVKQQWTKGNTESWVDVVHAIEPNDNRDSMSPLARNMRFRSVHYETGAKAADGFLRESGFPEFPIMAPRWEVVGEDIYAPVCPGIDTLGDVKALQLGEKRSYQAIDKQVDPPVQGPASLRHHLDRGGLLPGDKVFLDDMSQGGFRSIYDLQFDHRGVEDKNMKAEDRISRAFYEDLFLMLANSDRRQITAREIEERHEEKLLMLGPVLERLHNELLDPLIDRTFQIMSRAGILPVPPEELEDVELRVEYISTLAQAQRMVAVGGIERFGSYVGELSALYPEVRHKFNATQSIDDYAEALGVNPKLVVPDEDAKAAAAQEAQAAQAAQVAEMANSAAQTAKTVGDTDGESMAQLMNQMGVGVG